MISRGIITLIIKAYNLSKPLHLGSFLGWVSFGKTIGIISTCEDLLNCHYLDSAEIYLFRFPIVYYLMDLYLVNLMVAESVELILC